jgi:hypothetical protein
MNGQNPVFAVLDPDDKCLALLQSIGQRPGFDLGRLCRSLLGKVTSWEPSGIIFDICS